MRIDELRERTASDLLDFLDTFAIDEQTADRIAESIYDAVAAYPDDRAIGTDVRWWLHRTAGIVATAIEFVRGVELTYPELRDDFAEAVYAALCDSLDPSDERLVARFAAGDREAFDQLQLRYAVEIKAYVQRRYFRDDSNAADDVTQVAFLKAFEQIDAFDRHRRFLPWLVKIASHAAIDMLRSNRVRSTASLSGKDERDFDLIDSYAEVAPDTASTNERDLLLRASLTCLRPNDREAVELVYFTGFSYADAAAMLGMPLGSLKTCIARSLRKLRNAIGNQETFTGATA